MNSGDAPAVTPTAARARGWATVRLAAAHPPPPARAAGRRGTDPRSASAPFRDRRRPHRAPAPCRGCSSRGRRGEAAVRDFSDRAVDPIQRRGRAPRGGRSPRWRPEESGSPAQPGARGSSPRSRRPSFSIQSAGISSRSVRAPRSRRKPHQLASCCCASSEARKACASSFFSNTCGAMLRRVNACPSFIRMKALVAKRVMVV